MTHDDEGWMMMMRWRRQKLHERKLDLWILEKSVFEMRISLLSSDLRQRLHNRIEQRSDSLCHLQQFEDTCDT